MEDFLTDGVHYLSGIGHTVFKDRYDDDIEGELFCIDGNVYGAYIDPDDGWRSYGVIQKVDAKCQYTFPPQAVLIEHIDENRMIKEDDWFDYVKRELLVIKDAKNLEEVLVVGTDRTDDYYPCAIFNYTPENLEINKEKLHD